MLMGATIASGNRQPASVAVATDVVSMSKGSNSMNYRTFTLERLDTPTGPILIVTDEERVLRAVDWEDHEPRMQRLLQRHYGNGAIRLNETARPSAARGALRAYFDGHIEALRALPAAAGGGAGPRPRRRGGGGAAAPPPRALPGPPPPARGPPPRRAVVGGGGGPK